MLLPNARCSALFRCSSTLLPSQPAAAPEEEEAGGEPPGVRWVRRALPAPVTGLFLGGAPRPAPPRSAAGLCQCRGRCHCLCRGRCRRPRARSVKQMLPSKMTFQALFLSLFCLVLGKANVITQTEHMKVNEGDIATLSCTLTEPEDVLQVTWQKDSEKTHNNIATYSTLKGLKIHEPYQDRMNFTSLVLNDTSITFWAAKLDDTGCYTCLFNVFPRGSLSGRTCLSVFGLSASVHYNISEGHLIAICNAVGLPEPTVSWNNLFNYTPTQERVRHSNGVVSITSKLEISDSQSISKQDLTCRVSNKNEEMELPVKIKNEEGFSFLGLMIALGILLVILVLILITLRWRKRICKRTYGGCPQINVN
nr:OX-2 membrane glycoprotein-like isoform X2 [Anser cygnoides]XP_047913056.1 OX-2 membrane glycoprotein-like isoform X2 [Anser cygnoides]XP_047913057.1 OX-2 membrane glycoprotein-like isoform X2 [Anser cygnoides]